MSIHSNKAKNMMAYWILNQGRILTTHNVKRLSMHHVQRIAALKNRITDSLFGDLDIYHTIYNSYVTLGIEDDGNLVGAVCFDIHPSIKSLPPWCWERWARKIFHIDLLTPMNTKWINFLAFDVKYITCFLTPMLEVMFSEDRELEYIVFAIPPGINIATFLTESASRIGPKNYYTLHDVTTLGLLSRQEFFKKYKIRKAVEEDNDDIVAIIDQSSTRLKQLYGEYYISELLSRIEKSTRQIVVAEYNGYAVAVLIVNEEVNYDILNESFEVGPFHGFRKVHEDDEYTTHAADTSHQPSIVKEDSLFDNLSLEAPIYSDIMSIESRASSEEEKGSEESEYSTYSESSSEDLWTIDPSLDLSTLLMKREETSLEYFDLTGFFKTGSRSSLLSTCLLNTVGGDSNYASPMQGRLSSRTSLSEVKTIRQDILKKIIHCPKFYGEPNAFALEVLVTQPGHEQAIPRLLRASFECFKNKNYCLLCAPSTDVSYNLLDNFVRVTPRNHSTFPHDLYVLHRNTVNCEMKVRLSTEDDHPYVLEFLKQMLKEMDITRQYLDAVENPDSPYMALIMICQNQIIGLAVISEHVDLNYLFAHYTLYEWVDDDTHGVGSVGVLENLLIYPVFQKSCKFFLNEIHRLADFSLLVYSVEYKDLDIMLSDRHVLNCIQYLTPVRPRYLPEYDANFIEESIFPPKCVTETRDVFALFISMVRLTGVKRVEINTRLVVIGTGDTATAFLETLVCGSRPDLLVTFTNITVVSPHGLPFYKEDTSTKGMSPLTSGFTIYHRVLQMYLRINVNIVHGVLTAIKRKKKIIIVNEVTHVPYDYLILFCGEQYKLPTMKLKGRKTTTDFPDNFFTINTDNDVVQVFNRIETYKKDFMNKKVMKNDYVIVYGKDLRAVACLASLIEHGIPTHVLALVEPNTIQYFCSDNPESSNLVFTDPEIAEAVNRIIENLGVRVLRGYVLNDWKLEENNKVSKIELVSNTKPIHLGCKFMFMYADKSISNKTYAAIQKAGLVFDGRLVIDARFCTNDPCIFAAGSLTKYSRKYHAEYKSHIYYNANEVGEKIALQFREMLIPEQFRKYERQVVKTEVPEKMMQVETSLPEFRKPIVTYCWLPGDVYYLNVAAPGKQVPVEFMMASDNYGRLLITGDCDNLERQGYFKLYINQNQTVESICCLHKELRFR
ncbi:hypothetical protein WA026_022182 [Henosepilachna vigintioctopunctata]|uniref:Cilia- and flagella-associated protein 61 N-terminal domain-containing protein n=1 Tax=Henosepilachna vigintioctopunctata TaxID=420089 RepID=A0AAW1U075_9CUCU